MPPLIAAVLLGAGAYAGFRAARHIWINLTVGNTPGSPAPAPPADPVAKDLGTLVRDPETGVYRPVQKG